MSNAETPKIVEVRVIPVAGEDSMLMNLSGTHGPYFTRNIVILKDSSGNIGVGEVPGGQKIEDTLNKSAEIIIGSSIGAYKSALNAVRDKFSTLDSDGRGLPDIVWGATLNKPLCKKLLFKSTSQFTTAYIFWSSPMVYVAARMLS